MSGMTLYDELFDTYEALVENNQACTADAYVKQSVYPYEMVVNELERLCEEGDFIQEGNEYKVYVP